VTVVTDDFNRANGGLGANYTNFLGGGLTIASNRVVGTTSEERANLRTAESFTADQYAKITLTIDDFSGAKFIGVVLRGSGSEGTRNCYLVDVGQVNQDWHISKYVAGSHTSLATGAFVEGTLQIGDVFEGRVEGDEVSLWLNGVMVDSANDSAHATGSPGLYTFTIGEFDNAEFGDIGATTPVLSLPTVTSITTTGATPRVTITI
jgi:hypothetical protein